MMTRVKAVVVLLLAVFCVEGMAQETSRKPESLQEGRRKAAEVERAKRCLSCMDAWTKSYLKCSDRAYKKAADQCKRGRDRNGGITVEKLRAAEREMKESWFCWSRLRVRYESALADCVA